MFDNLLNYVTDKPLKSEIYSGGIINSFLFVGFNFSWILLFLQQTRIFKG